MRERVVLGSIATWVVIIGSASTSTKLSLYFSTNEKKETKHKNKTIVNLKTGVEWEWLNVIICHLSKINMLFLLMFWFCSFYWSRLVYFLFQTIFPRLFIPPGMPVCVGFMRRMMFSHWFCYLLSRAEWSSVHGLILFDDVWIAIVNNRIGRWVKSKNKTEVRRRVGN